MNWFHEVVIERESSRLLISHLPEEQDKALLLQLCWRKGNQPKAAAAVAESSETAVAVAVAVAKDG